MLGDPGRRSVKSNYVDSELPQKRWTLRANRGKGARMSRVLFPLPARGYSDERRSVRQTTERIYDEDVVPVEGQMVPLSDHFGMRSVVTVP